MRKLEIGKVFSLLHFRANQSSMYGGVVYHGIEEAFPYAEIAETKGIYQQTRPNPPYALISISHAVTVDGRIGIVTRLGEEVDLSNRTVSHASNSIQPVTLPVQEPSSEEDLGVVVLVRFGSKPTTYGRYQAFCEGILLSSAQSNQVKDIVPDTPRLERYAMSTRDPRGLCIIINNLEFHNKRDNRYGGEFDEDKLVNLFEDLSFSVRVKHDLKYNEIMDTAEEYALQDHTEFDAFVMIVMTHGGDGDAICGVSGKRIGVKELMAEFKVARCPSLENKPKIFIFEACRRSLISNAVPTNGLNKRFKADAFSPDSSLPLSVTPPEADFLLAFATTPGNYSWRHEESGSLYIQVLVEVIRELHQHHHLHDMLTEVNRRVAERASNEIDSQDVQIPAPVHTLRAQLYL